MNTNQENQEFSVDLVPFIARAIAEKPAARRQLDAIYADSRIVIKKISGEKTKVYSRYFQESSVLAELSSQKAADLIMNAFEPDDNGRQILAALEKLLKHCWPHLYAYVCSVGAIAGKIS